MFCNVTLPEPLPNNAEVWLKLAEPDIQPHLAPWTLKNGHPFRNGGPLSIDLAISVAVGLKATVME